MSGILVFLPLVSALVQPAVLPASYAVHRSSIVNVDAIRELRPGFHGDFEVVLRNGDHVRLSHRYRRNLERNGLGAL